MSKTITIEKRTVINKSLDAVWKVSATDFEHIDQWDANVKSSKGSGQAGFDAPVKERTCNLYNGKKMVERFLEFNAEQHNFTYEIAQGLPSFVVSARNTWIHKKLSADKTELTMRVTMKVTGILGFIMQVPMKAQMGKVLGKAQEELKHYIETGQAHIRKRRMKLRE